jgi:hypothetical protein
MHEVSICQTIHHVATCTSPLSSFPAGSRLITQPPVVRHHRAADNRASGGIAGAPAPPLLLLPSPVKKKNRAACVPAGGMLREALTRYGAAPAKTPFVGDQADDLKAAFRVGCRRVLVRTGLGRKTLAKGLPTYVQPVAVFDDLTGAVDAKLRGII